MEAIILKEELILYDQLKQTHTVMCLSQVQLAKLVGVLRDAIGSIETGQLNPIAELVLILCITLEQELKGLFYFDKT